MRSASEPPWPSPMAVPTVIGEAVLDPILPPLHLVVCGAGPDAGPLVAAGVRLGWRVSVVDARRSFLRADRFPGAVLHDVEPAKAADAVGAGEWTAVVLMSHDYLRDAAYLGGFIGRGVRYLGVLGPRDRTDRLLAELDVAPTDADLAALHAPAGLDLGADGAEEVATAIVAEILAALRRRHGRPAPGPARSHPRLSQPRAQSGSALARRAARSAQPARG